MNWSNETSEALPSSAEMSKLRRFKNVVKSIRRKVVRSHFAIGLSILLLLPIILVLLPIVLPITCLLDHLEQRRENRMLCPACGVPFGAEQVKQARSAARDENEASIFRAADQGIRLRTVIMLQLTCRACHAEFYYDTDNKTIWPVDEDRAMRDSHAIQTS